MIFLMIFSYPEGPNALQIPTGFLYTISKRLKIRRFYDKSSNF